MEKQYEKKIQWTIKNFSSLESDKVYSDNFVVGDSRWRLGAYPKGNAENVNNNSNWGFPSMLPLTKLLNIKDGFLVNGEVKIVVEVGVLEVVGKSDVLVETPLVNETIDLNGFQVLPSQVESVNNLFENHPDIASKFCLENPLLRTTYLNSLLCLTEILSQSPEKLSSVDLGNAYCTLSSLTKAGFKLDWLEKKLKEVGDTRVQQLEQDLKDLKEKFMLDPDYEDNLSRF
ncbi:hypothetical protein AXX17_AT1G32040 [Arabidopsis thaliana]|uniref:MATH domain-containing protein n=1 Tax=Arabidopsis thaliana TaxID=3702 RepID=A0A178WED2_ARATH|nr:hypothetical protein AXX17_AT1G32040 [Arabidopsis thaliana]